MRRRWGWWLFAAGGLALAARHDGDRLLFIQLLIAGTACAYLAYLMADMALFSTVDFGTVRQNKRALHKARKKAASGDGSQLRVLWLRLRLRMALRARNH